MLPTINNAKNLFWNRGAHLENELHYFPDLYLEAKIDFNDVRTGFKETYNISRALTLPLNLTEPVWDDDALRDIDPENLGTDIPEKASFNDIPEYVDGTYLSWVENQFVQYLLRTFKAKIYRNFGLSVYSYSGESRNDFIIRCLDLSNAPLQRKFDSLHDVFKLKLARLQRKFIGNENSEEQEEFKTETRNREIYNRISDRISSLFLRNEFSRQRFSQSSENDLKMNELDERLRELLSEAQEAVVKILDRTEEKAGSIDEYILHPTWKGIHFVRCCVLWIPEEAA